MMLDDVFLQEAKKLIAENEDELRARLVAQALRLAEQAEQHRLALLGREPAASSQIAAVADLLAKHPHLLEPTVQFLETQLRGMIARAEEGSDAA